MLMLKLLMWHHNHFMHARVQLLGEVCFTLPCGSTSARRSHVSDSCYHAYLRSTPRIKNMAPSGLVWADDEDDEPAFACLIGNVPTSLAEADLRDLIGELKVMTHSRRRDRPRSVRAVPLRAQAIMTPSPPTACTQISGLRAIEGERAHTWRVELTTEADLKSTINTMNGVRVWSKSHPL